MNSSTSVSRLLLSLLILCFDVEADPDPKPISNDDFICRYDGSQREMNACAIRDYVLADKRLNDAYAEAMSRFQSSDSLGIRLLLVEQRDWIKRRDARCNPKKDDPGENATIDFLTCMQAFTEIRTLQLKAR